jgi:nitrous oxidase accessory protein NosD
MRFATLHYGIVALVFCASGSLLADITLKPGESIQKAIDAAPDGSTVVLDAGTFHERLNINKPLTLRGAGADKTILQPEEQATQLNDKQKIEFVDRLLAQRNQEEQFRIVAEFIRHPIAPTINVRAAHGVTLQGLRVRGPAPTDVDAGMTDDSLIQFAASDGKIVDCVIIGPFMNGVSISDGSAVEISKTLVAAMWGTGVRVFAGSSDGKSKEASKVHLVDSDLRNCYHRCMTIACDGSTIERCRISGSAWHGIRYDNCSPTVTDCFIFANARFGIYASGKTHATIRGNVFWKNEMDGVSCWFNNEDVIEQNTFVANLREGMALCGEVKPTITKNIFIRNPVAIIQSKINDRNGGASGDPQPTITDNVFWKNEKLMQRMEKDEPLPPGNVEADPKLPNEATLDFNASDATEAGAHHAVSAKSPWPIQPEEKQIIPDGETRDYQQWKKPESAK